MFILLSSTVLVCLLVWISVRWGNVRRYWAERNVPHYPPHPVMGSLTFLQRENPAVFMKKMYQDFQSSYVGIWLFWRPGLIINSPAIARNVLVKDADVFRNRFLSSGQSDPVGGLNLFTVNDPTWSSVRRRLTTVFTAAKLRALQGLTVKKSDDLVQRIKSDMKTGEISDLRALFSDYTTDVFGEAAFGVLSESTRTGDSSMRKVTREFMEFSIIRGLSWCSIFFFPELVDIFRFSLFPKKTTEFLRRILLAAVDQRAGIDKDTKENRDLLDALLKMKKEAAEDGEEIKDDLILAQAAIFLLGAFDTSGGALTWATLELSHHPHIQEKLYMELSEAKRRKNCTVFDPTTLSELPYLNAVIKEVLRKFPSMGWLDRVAGRDYVIDDKLTIQAGTVVYVNAVGMQWDPDNFPEPGKFDPDRFLPENEGNIKPYTFMPFGEGPRGCIGKYEVCLPDGTYGLASVVLNYHLRPTSSTPKSNDVIIEKKGLFQMPGENLPLQFIPRNSC